MQEFINSEARHYINNEMTDGTYEKLFNRLSEGEMLLKLCQGQNANISDCVIALPVCLYGVASFEAIYTYISALKKANKDIYVTVEEEYVKTRLEWMYECGFLLKLRYQLSEGRYVLLYGAPINTIELVTKKLDVRVTPHKWTAALPFYKILGKAATGYVASYLVAHKNYVGLDDCAAQFKKSHTTLTPELKFQTANGNKYIVAVYPSFVQKHDVRIQTKDDYQKVVMNKVYFVEEYLQFRNKEKEPNVVVVVENSEDLNFMARLILSSGLYSEEMLGKIFFTGEGIFLEASRRQQLTSMKDCFLKLGSDGKFVETTPSFLL